LIDGTCTPGNGLSEAALMIVRLVSSVVRRSMGDLCFSLLAERSAKLRKE
jgi:hypothetical protein